jgi:hypothetical protein
MIVVFDGPEKAGKTTLIYSVAAYLQGFNQDVKITKWGPLATDDREYTPVIREQLAARHVVHLWDRSWASEHVYGNLLGRDRRLANDPWLGEWLHRRALIGNGMAYMVLPALAGQNIGLRDSSDLDVDVYSERAVFHNYATQFRWGVVYNNYDEDSLRRHALEIGSRILRSFPRVDDPRASVLFVGENLRDVPEFPGRLLPFSGSKLQIDFARRIGEPAILARWNDVEHVEDIEVEGASKIYFLGKKVAEAFKGYKPRLDQQVEYLMDLRKPDQLLNSRLYQDMINVLQGYWNATPYF